MCGKMHLPHSGYFMSVLGGLFQRCRYLIPGEGAAECRHWTLPCSTKRLPEMAESTNETRAEPGKLLLRSREGITSVLMAASPPLFRTQIMKGFAEWTQGRKNLGPFDTQGPRASGFWVSLQPPCFKLHLQASPCPVWPVGESGPPLWLQPSFVPGLLPGPRGFWAQSQS